MHAIEFARYISSARSGRRIMARIALNALGHADHFPVDISELRDLCPHNRAVVNAFLEWAVSHGDFRYNCTKLPQLQRFARAS